MSQSSLELKALVAYWLNNFNHDNLLAIENLIQVMSHTMAQNVFSIQLLSVLESCMVLSNASYMVIAISASEMISKSEQLMSCRLSLWDFCDSLWHTFNREWLKCKNDREAILLTWVAFFDPTSSIFVCNLILDGDLRAEILMKTRKKHLLI